MNERTKIIQLDERFSHTGEPTVQAVVLWGPRNRPCYETLSKEASASPAYEYIKAIQPVPGRTIVLVIGLGSFEWYGLNRNGDGFNEQPYKVGQQPTCGCCIDKNREAWITEEECVTRHYKSYEQGHCYLHHTNKNPARAIGNILKAFWNSYMHRVEVLEDIDNNKAPEIVGRIADGELLAKSMGCRIKYDVCTKCGHRSPTRQQYCDHLKWEMGHLDPQTGIRYGALNPSPRFFDSSWVVRPADRTGYMLKKVAIAYELQPLDSSRAGELIDTLHAKAAAARKLAVIDKVVRGYPAAMVQSELPEAPLVEQYRKTSLPGIVTNTPELNSTDIQTLSSHQLPPLLSALSRAGIILTTPEFIRLFMAKAAPGVEIPNDVLENITALQSEFFDLLNQRPSLLHELTQTLSSGAPATEAIQRSVTPLLEKRSTISDYLSRRFTPEALKYDESPNTELLQVTNPNTGQQYQTNRGAVRDAEDAMARSQIGKLLGSAGLMAAAYKTMAGVPGIHPLWSLPLGVGALAMGRSGLAPRRGYQTQTGEEIPYITELREKRSGVMDVTTALGMDYRITKTATPLIDRVLKRTHSTQPLYLLLQKNASWGLCASNLSLNDWATQSEKAASDGLTEPPIDLDKLAHIIGTLVWEVP